MRRQNGRLAQRERRSLTRTRSGVQIPHRPPRQAKGAVGCSDGPFFRSRTRTNVSRETSSVEALSSRAALVANRDDTLPPGLRTFFASMLRFERVAGASILVTWENAAPGQPAACEAPSGKAPTQHLGANCAKRRRKGAETSASHETSEARQGSGWCDARPPRSTHTLATRSRLSPRPTHTLAARGHLSPRSTHTLAAQRAAPARCYLRPFGAQSLMPGMAPPATSQRYRLATEPYGA